MNNTGEKLVETKKIDDILNQIKKDRYCLPSFQRDFVWKPEQMAKLIESIVRHYPIGTFLLLNYEKNKDIGKHSFVSTKEYLMDPKYYVIDGQQRLRTILQLLDCEKYSEQELFEKSSKDYLNKKYKIMISVNINVDNIPFDEDISRLSFTKVVKYDDVELDSNDYEGFYKSLLENYDKSEIKYYVPVEILLNDALTTKWIKITGLGHGLKKNIYSIKKRIESYEYVIERLERRLSSKDNSNMFRLLNEAGTDLTLFDLLAAHLYSKGINLRDLWNETKKIENIHNYDIDPIYILKVLIMIRKTKMEDKSPTCNKADMKKIYNLFEGSLNIEKDFSNDWGEASEYVNKALSDLKKNYGAFRKKYIPYTPMIVTLAAIKWWISKYDQKFKPKISEKMERWYWISIFSRYYDQATDNKISEQYVALKGWLDPRSLRMPVTLMPDFDSDKKSLIRMLKKDIKSSSDARYKAVMCLPFAKKQAIDFSDCQFLDDQKEIIHDHHIFAKSKLRKKGYEPSVINCVINRILITHKTHSTISTRPPYDYLEKANNATLKSLLLPKILKNRAISYEDFFEQRAEMIATKLIDIIKQ